MTNPNLSRRQRVRFLALAVAVASLVACAAKPSSLPRDEDYLVVVKTVVVGTTIDFSLDASASTSQ